MTKTRGGIGNVTELNELVAMAMSYSRSRVICAAARLGVADAIGDGEMTTKEIAEACGADSDSLYRLLRVLASLGVVAETTPGSFVLTSSGQSLRKDAQDSVWPSVIFWADLLADSWSYLTDCVQTGKTAFQVMESLGVASRWSQVPDANAIFRAVMGTGSAENYAPIVDCWDFSSSRTVADLGGGGGALLRAVLSAYPDIQGILVDWQESVDRAAPAFEAEGLAHRVKLVGSDLMEGVPTGADTYMLKHVLHGCQDDRAVTLLQNCREAMSPEGVLLVIEFVLPDVVSAPDSQLEIRLMSDLNMMAVTGGKERSATEWSTLLKRSGFEPGPIIPVWEKHPGQEVSIIEARPRARANRIE